MIELVKVNKFYRSKEITFHALKDISLQIEDGEFIAIKGKSGAGKSTLMHILGCADTFDSGSYFLDGTDVGKLSNNSIAKIRNRKIGFVMQDYALISKLSVFENIAVPLYLGNTPFRKIKALTEKAASEVGIHDQLYKKANQLSGGQQQRAAIARAIVNSPSIILADEPTGALDEATAKDVMRLLQKQNENGKTVIIITHDDAVANYCSRKINIADGKIVL